VASYATRAVAELRRIVKTGGPVLLIETMGTGVDAPTAPTPQHTDYYDWLAAQGFRLRVLRTDYVFRSAAEGRALVDMFFGPQIAGRLSSEPAPRLREFTGVWWT
jgi:hypothetical protein